MFACARGGWIKNERSQGIVSEPDLIDCEWRMDWAVVAHQLVRDAAMGSIFLCANFLVYVVLFYLIACARAGAEVARAAH